MRLEAVLLAVMLSLSGSGLFAQTPRPPKPKPVEDVPIPDVLPPDIGPGILAVPTRQTSATRTWTMFNNEPWPSEQILASLTRGCYEGRGGFFLYDLGPSAQQTIMLEKIAQDLKKDPF